MKRTILLLILVGITFLSCSENLDNTIISSPTEAEKFTNLQPSIQPQLYASKLVDGSIGCDFIYDTTFINTQGREINVYARLKIEPGAFKGLTKFIMIPYVEDLSIKLFPEMIFNEEVKLTLIFTGIDLKTFGYTTTGKVDFAYFPDYGEFQLIESDMSHVNIPRDQIKVMNARLNHFSRYGWIR